MRVKFLLLGAVVGVVLTLVWTSRPDPTLARLRARADSLAAVAQEIQVDTVERERTVYVARQTSGRIAEILATPPKDSIIGPRVSGDTTICWPIRAFRDWRDRLQQAIRDDSLAWESAIAVRERSIARRDSLIAGYRASLDSALAAKRPSRFGIYVGPAVGTDGRIRLGVGVGLRIGG